MNKIEEFKKILISNDIEFKIKEEGDKLIIQGDLYLRNTQIKELPEGLTVGGYLDLSNTQIKELPEGLTVGGSLYLSNTQIKELPKGLMVEGNIYFSNIVKQGKRLKKGYNWERNYIYFDNILWGNVKSIKKIENKTIYKTPLGYCVVEKETSAHGKNLREAMEDLIYKETQKEDKEKIVAEIKKTGKVNRAQYRAITRACKYGTNKFCEEHNIQNLEEISLEELRKILINDYGAKKFWSLIDKEDNL